MAGETATIVVQEFRRDWDTGLPIRDICERWTITKDQFLRLRDLWGLDPRHDHKKRPIVLRGDSRDPTPEEIAGRARQIRAGWSAETELARRVSGRPVVFELRTIDTSQITADVYTDSCLPPYHSDEVRGQ